MKKYYSLTLNFLAGVLLAFAYPHLFGKGFSLFAVLAFSIYYFTLLKEFSLKKMLIQTFVFCFGFSVIGFYWIPQTLSTFGGISLELGYSVSIFFALIVLPYLWPQVFLYYFLKKKQLSHFSLLVSLCCSHVVLEQLTPTQFPVWLGHSILSNETSLPFASFFGAGIYSFTLIILVLFLPELIKKNTQALWPCLLSLSILCSDYIYGVNYNYLSAISDSAQQTLKVRIVQANIGNFLKLSSEDGEENSVSEVYRHYSSLSFQEPLDFNLLIWPETAVPTLFNSKTWDEHNSHTYLPIKKIFQQLPMNAGFVFGGYDENTQKMNQRIEMSEFNTAFFYQNKKLDAYYKIKLIPFGETLPFGSFNQTFAPYFPGVSLFSQGTQFHSFAIDQDHQFISPICYELLDTFFIRNFLNSHKDISFIVNLTNDSWYGDTAQPWQHLFLARWRALEFRRPIIRSTNTGITTIIDEEGKISTYLGINEKNILDIKIHLHHQAKTIYQQWGLLPLNFLLLIFLSFYLLRPALIKSWRRKTPNNS